MKHETVNKARVLLAFSVALLLIAIYLPDIGLWLALLWLALVVWQLRAQQK